MIMWWVVCVVACLCLMCLDRCMFLLDFCFLFCLCDLYVCELRVEIHCALPTLGQQVALRGVLFLRFQDHRCKYILQSTGPGG